MAQDQENSYKLWQALSNDYDMGSYEQFKKDVQDATKRQKLYNAIKDEYDLPDFDGFSKQLGIVSTAAEQQPTGQAGAAPAGQTTSAGEMVGQAAQQEQPTVEPSASQTRAQVKPAAVQQSAPAYNFTYFDESAIDPDEGELRMSKTPAGWKYSERVNKSRGSHTKDNSPILRMSLNGDQLDANAEREALAELKDMSDEEIYKYTNGLYDLAWGSLTNDQRREAASRLAAAGQELHARDLGLGHYGDAYRRENAWRTILQDPEYRKLYDRGQWADPVGTLSKQYDRLFAEQATGGTMGQQQATKIANRVLRAADKNQMFTWALQEAERTGGDPYKIYENIYDRFHAAVKEKLGAYNTRGQAAGLLGDIDAMIAEKYSAAEEADRSRRSGFARILSDAMNADRGGDHVEDILMNDPDMWALRYAKRTIEGVNNLIAEADHNAASGNFGAWLESSFAGGAARGFGQAVFDARTWDMGFGDVRDATALMTALDKSDKGIPLTKAEQAMLDAKAVELAANAYFKSQVGYGYEAGKVTGESLPFMLEMMINPASSTGGLAVNKLVRYALKRFPQRGAAAVERQAVRAAERRAVRMAERRGMSTFGEKAANRILESAGLLIETAGKKTAGGKAVRAAVKTAGNVAGSAVMAGTTGLPGVIADTENRMIGQLDYDADETGAFHVTGHGFGVPMIEAFKDALVARGIENVTEMSEFDVLSNWLGGLTRKALDKLHMSDVYKFFDDIKMSDVAKVVQDFEKNTHWQGTFGEYLEEVEGGILNAWLVGDQTLDQNPDTGVFNVDNNVKTFLGVSLLGGAFSTVQTIGYRTPKARMRKDIEDADKQASELWGGTWQQFKNSVDAADDEEMEVLLANIVVNGNYSVDQRRAAAQYIKSVVAYRGAMKGEEIRAVSGESNPNDEQSYEQGYQAQGEEREGITDDLQQAEQRLIDIGFNMDSFEGWTSDKFERAIKGQDHGYSDEELSVIREYLRAKAASDGINHRVEDDIDTQVQQASDLVDKQTNQGTGMVHRAVLKNGQEVYVTGGQLVMTGDGVMIDTEASDQSLFVYNPATGQPEQYTPSDFQSVDDPVSPEQLKSEAARDIRMSVEQQAQNEMNGVLPFQVGDTYEILTNGQPATVTVVEDQGDNVAVQRAGSQQVEIVPKQQIQEAARAMKQAKRNAQMPATLPTRSTGARDNTENTGRVGNATNGTAAVVEPMPMDEKGEPAWEQSTPERGHQYLVNESGLGGEDITSLIDARIAQADAAIEKASKGGSINERLAARKAKDYWEGVKRLHEAAMAQPAATGTTAQQSPTGHPTTTGQDAPAGTVRVEAGQAETMPVGYTAVNIDGTRAEDRGQLGIRPEDEAYFLKSMSPRMMGLLNKVAKSLGWKIRLYNGVNSQERGLYNDGVVWVNRRAMTSKLAQWILGHEMTHGMGSRTRRGETFKDYKAMATAYHRSQVGDEQYEREVAALIKAYQDHLRSLGMDTSVVTREYVEEEIACDVTGDLLMNNPEMIGKLFSGVESPSKLKRIIDMIVDALDWIKKKLSFRSEEKQAFDDLIQRLNNLYRDAKAQTDIAKATAREEGSQIESGEGDREGSSFSITGNAEGSGFTASETVLEIWRVPQEDGTYKEEEHWVKKPLLDSEGNVVFRMGDKEFSGKNPITVEDLKSNPDTVLNYMLADALNAGTIDETKADQVRQQYADMLNLYLEKGMATEDGNGFENLEKKWLWVGETVFRTVASNSDEQYSYSMDITKVCKKNEAVIRAISAMQVKTGYGVTPAQILEIYETTDAEGFQVPCPVCYVFSRYINNGKYATAIVNGMKKYGKYLPGQPDAKPVEWWVKEMKDAQARAKKMETPIKNANDDVKVILQQIDALCREITSGKLSKEEAESKRRHVRALDQRYRAALDVISQEALPRWIKAFVIEGSDQGGWSLREDAALPEDMDDFTLHALDIRKTASAMEKYPSLTRYRRAGGSAGGKEITFASNNELGTIAMGLGISKDKLDDYPNYYQLAAEASTDEERQALLQKARERFEKARVYAQRQTLRGGQRMWSWSDNIESLSSDVASNLMQLELLGGALQTYSKQLEGVKMVAAMNGYVNASLMGYGDGIREVGPDEIDDNGRLKDNIWDVNNKGRRRIIANAGSPVYHNEADGKDYVLVFDDVVGIDPFGHGGKRGLFSLNEEYDRAGNILVGMNDIHVRAAMADPRVFFIIPWHASGMSNHILKQMFNILGVNMDQFVSTDYTKMQEETNYLLKKDDGSPKKKVPKEVEDFWDSHTYEDEFACGTGHIENGDRDGGLSESQLHYRALRDAIFDGAVKEGTEEYDQIMADEFLSQVYRQVTTRVADGKMTEKDKEFIYPYEYWDETSTVENADVNGRRYVEYCRRMGFKPKFTGKYDDKTGYSPEGNFADDPGYWKLLIDRRMYDRRGNYQDLTPVDSSGLDSSMYDPDQTSEEFNVTEVATNEGAEKIADAVYQNDIDRTGSMPAPNLDMTMDEAVARYKAVTSLQASLIKAEREALTAADVAKQKAEKAKALKAADVDGRKAKSVARAKESARKAMEVAKQKAREVEEIASRFGDNGRAVAHGTNARFSLEDPRFREVVNNGGRLQIIQSRKGTFRDVYDYETGERRKVRSSHGGWRIEGMPGEYDSREAAINEWRERSSGDLLWSVSDDGKYIEVEGEGDALERLSGRANDPARAERWAQQRAENGRRIADDMAGELGVTVHYVDDMTDEERAALSDRQRRAKGWFDPRTGDVYINLGNHNRLYDIVSTVLHNVVANKGLRGLFGESFPGFLDQVYNNVDKHTRAEIDRIAERNDGDRRDATEEYLALMAERMDIRHPENYQYYNDAVRDFVIEEWKDGNLKWGHAIEDDDLRRVLFESYHNMQREGAMGMAQSVAFRDQVERERAAQSAAIPRQANAVAEDDGVRFSIRTKPAPKKTITVYKLMRLGDDGKLYPLYIDGAVPIELGQWYDADSPNMEMLVNLPAGVHLINPETGESTSLEDYNKQRGITKKSKYPSAEAVNEATANGMRWVYIEPTKGSQRRFGGEARRYWNLGINGSGTVSTYSMRPGWHAGSLPTMRQIGKGPGRNLRDDRFVWVEGEISADVDYNEEAKGNPDKDIPTHIPVDGFYLKATNANAKASQADRVGWYISGAFKPNRIMSDSEARQKIDEWNADPKHKDLQVEYDFPRESGKVFNAETMQLEEARYSLVTENDTEEIQRMHDTIDTWMTPENLDKANQSMEGIEDSGQRRQAVFNAFNAIDNALHPINYVPNGFMQFIWGEAPDNRTYTSMAYFIDHAVNHHPNIDWSRYHEILDVISKPEEIKETFTIDHNTGRPKRSVVFLKVNGDRHNAVVVSIEKDENGNYRLFYKSYFDQKKKKKIYKNIPNLWDNVNGEAANLQTMEMMLSDGSVVTFMTLDEAQSNEIGAKKITSDSLMGGGTIIGSTASAVPGRNRLSPPNESLVLDGKDNTNSSPDQGNSKNRAKNFEEGAKTTGNGEDIRFSFAGPVGAEALDALDSGRRMADLDVAKDMERAGKDARTIKLATGWERGTDNKWRYEMADVSPIVFKLSKARTLGDIVDMNGLDEVYPILKEYTVSFKGVSRGAAGEVSHKRKEIKMSKTYNTERVGVGNYILDDYGMKTIVHEIQHVIQKVEGFARGTNENMEAQEALQERRDGTESPELLYFAAGIAYNNTPGNLIAYGNESLAWKLKSTFPDRNSKQWQLGDYIEKMDPWLEYRDFVYRAANLIKYAKEEGPKRYHNSAGEVEARNVEKRYGMSAEERRGSLAEETEDVPRSEQIVRYEGDNSERRYSLSNNDAERELKSYEDAANAAISSWNIQELERVIADLDSTISALEFQKKNSKRLFNRNRGRYELLKPLQERLDGDLRALVKKTRTKNKPWGVEETDDSLTHDDLDALFKSHNTDKTNARLWDKVLATSRLLGFDHAYITKHMPFYALGEVFNVDIIKFNYWHMNSYARTDNQKCATMLHELIHHVTTYALFIKDSEQCPAHIRQAAYQIVDVYNEIKDDPDFDGEYGINTEYEMIAELSNPVFRQKLKRKKLWKRILDGLMRLFGVEQEGDKETSAYKTLTNALDKIVSNPDIKGYHATLAALDDALYQEDTGARFSLSLGAPYQGSKGQIATRVVDALPGGRRFVDLFAGGGAVTHAAMLSGKYGEYRVNDINPAGLELFLKGINGDYRDYIPREMSAEEFKAIKGTAEGLMLSYGGLGRNVDPDKDSVARRVRRVQRLEDLKPYADQVESSNSDYRDVELEPGDVVYADIPYQGTNKTGYREGSRFDKQAFSDWALGQDVPIYVSEQSMPAGWVEVASWEMPSMNAQKKRGEKLFVQERFAGDGGRATAHKTPRFSISPEEQERQIHSDNFKNWFGDWENDPEHASKVVDEEGKPLVVSHWTDREFYEFDRDRLGENTGFNATDENFAKTAHLGFWFNHGGNSDTFRSAYGDNARQVLSYLDIKSPKEYGSMSDLVAELSNYETAEDFIADSKAKGFDGVIVNDEEFGGRSYVVFDPEQIKSATDNNGDFSRENPDIRFSVGEESQKIFDTAKRKFGETKDIREAGYVLPDGSMLDFSGRHELDPGTDSSFLAGRRATDHRAINQISFVYDENGDEVDTGVSSDMPDFIKRGAIRIDNNAGSINLFAAPTMAQRKVLRELIRRNGGDVQVDFGDGWNSDHYVEYEEASAQRVLGDIDRYFDEGIKPEGNARYSIAPTFYSNAAKAVEGVKQEKAKAEQWKAMLTKAGGIKAGEDKWMGLSQWLDDHKGQTLTKEEVAQFVRDNGIKMEEVEYAEYKDTKRIADALFKPYVDEFDALLDQAKDDNPSKSVYDLAEFVYEQMHKRYGNDFGDNVQLGIDRNDFPIIYLPTNEDGEYTTESMRYLGIDEDRLSRRDISFTRLAYTTNGLENKREIAFVVPNVEPYQETDVIHFGPENQGRAVMWVRFGETTDESGEPVLVIDEIQSNRHQDARENGYRSEWDNIVTKVSDATGFSKQQVDENPYDVANWMDAHAKGDEGRKLAKQLRDAVDAFDKSVPDAPFEKNWHEVAMKRMLRLAAEEGFDKVAWTTGEQQAERYNIGNAVRSIDWRDNKEMKGKRGKLVIIRSKNGTFDLNFLVDKDGRIIEYYQQYGTYGADFVDKNLSEVVGKEIADKIMSNDGVVREVNIASLHYKSYELRGDGLRIGGEGMKAFYDKMLPQFMNKYGKRWGVKTGEVTLNTPGRETMHSVDVNEDMKRSVMENGQPLFSLSGDGTVEEYNKAVNMTGRTFNVGGREVKPGITRYNFQEAFQDSILAVKKLQQVVERHFGIKLPTRENAWMYENRLSSINMHERKSFVDKVYEPMMKIADRIMKRGVKEKELNAYLICKHGLERNQVFAMRDANEEANEIVRNGGTPDMQQLIDKYRQRDYSGLTGVTGIQGDITDIEAEAQRIVDEFEQRHGQLCNELWDAIRKATQWSLRKSYQSGMMSAATFDHVRNMFQYYIPLRGWSETTAEDVYSYMMGEHGAFNGVLKKAEGRTSVADDPLATIGNMAESALIQGNRNLLKQHLLRMAQNHPTDVCQVRDVWLVEGPGGVCEPHWPNIPEDATPDEIDQILQDHENDMLQLEASGSAKRVRNNLDIPYRIDPRHVPEHAVVAKVAGVDHVVYINGNPRAAQAINGQTGAPRGTKSGFSRLIDFIFGDMKRFYSSVLTSLNINFSGANFVRDLPHAYAMTFIKQGPLKAAEYIAKSFQVIPWVFKNQLGKTGTSQMDRYFQEFLSSGAVTGYAHINDVDAWKADNKRRFARLSALGKAKVAVPRALGEVINAIGWFSETLELIPRFTAFLVERQAGKDIATATKAAKDITTNFNKKGSEVTPGVWGAVANTLRYMKMFFNPIVQGMYQFVDVASMGKENKWVGPRMVLATMHLPVLGAIVPYLNQFLLEALGGDDDDDYWLLNEYTRRNNVCIFTGNGYLKIPIAPVFRELYGMGEVVATRHAGKADDEKTTVDLIDQLRTMGSVEGQSSYNEWSLARFLLPEHFAPLIDVMNNENFTGGPIYYDNNYKEYAPEYTKAKKSTWSPLVAASKWLNEMMGGDEDIAAGNSGKWMNPAVWQHLITNVGGGFAQLAGDVVSGITDITEGKEIDASNIPVLKRFYSGSSDERANWARFGIYKDYEKDYAMAKEKYQALDKRGLSLTERADEMVKFAESHPRAAAIYAVWEGGIKGADIPQQLSKLGKDDPKYWDLVKDAVAKAEKAMNSGYVRAWEQKRKDRPDSMSDKELNDRFDKSDNDSIRHIMADEISKRAGSQDYYGRDAQAAWSDKSVAAWEAYQDQRTSDDIKADAELSNLLKVDEGEKDKERIKMLGFIKDELNKIRRGKDATSRSAGVKGLGEGDDQRVMNELRAARKQLIEDLKNGSAEQAYRNLERRTMRLGLRKKAKEL